MIIARHENAVMSTGQTAGLITSDVLTGLAVVYCILVPFEVEHCKFEIKLLKCYLQFITLFSVPAVFLFYLKTSSFPVLFVFEGE